MDMEHTLLPWVAQGDSCVRSSDGELIASCYGVDTEDNANAALIVHSVNRSPLFDELVDALQAARFYVPNTATSGHILATIDALITKATS